MIDDEDTVRRWLVAVVAVLIAFVLHTLMHPASGSASHLPFFLGLAIVAVASDRWPAALVLGAGLAVSVWRMLDGSTALPDSSLVRTVVILGYALLGTFIIYIGHSARRHAKERLRASKAELDLWRSSQTLQTILDLIPAGVAIAHDTTGNDITVSPRFARMLAIDHTVNAYCTGARRDSLPYRCKRNGIEIPSDELPLLLAARTGREVYDFEMDLVFHDGRVVHLLASAAPLYDAHRNVRGAIGVHTDVTAMKESQRELERMDRQKDIFLATLAHELRNPLAPIRYAAAVLRAHAGGDAALVQESGRIIERQTGQMRQLLDELLDMSRVTRDVIELQKVPVDLVRVVRHEIEALQPQLSELAHAVHIECASSAWVVGDETRLHQIVGNLLSNAAKYTHPGGRIDVTLRSRDAELELSVRDNGIGIASKDLPYVFDLFTQIHKPGTARSGGLGIGLAVVRRLVQLHGGSIAVTSGGPGAGTEFIVRLPCATEPGHKGGQPMATVAEPGPAARVLVCDDNVDAADSLASILQLHGLAVRVTYDGSSAKRAAEEFLPDIVVLDLGLPDVPGEDVARWIRGRPWGSEVPLIAVTGWGQQHDRARTAAAGFAHHLVKPVEPQELLKLIDQVGRSARAALTPGATTEFTGAAPQD
jgi:signal transduction histidine kinase/ActR/RegA family two-component response regulator